MTLNERGCEDMSGGTAITALKLSIKRLVRGDGFRWLDSPARRSWYYLQTVGELKNLPATLLRFRKNVRSQPAVELIDLTFSQFGGMFLPFQNKSELERLMERVASIKPRVVVEIGTARGGTLFLLSCVADPHAHLISIDLPAGWHG